MAIWKSDVWDAKKTHSSFKRAKCLEDFFQLLYDYL